MPTPEVTFNAIGGVMQAYQESLAEYQARVARLEKENEGLRQAVVDLGKQLLRGEQNEPPDDGSEGPVT